MAQVIKESVVRLSFETNLKELTKLQNEITTLKKKLTGDMGGDAFDKLKKNANNSADSLDKVKKSAADLTDKLTQVGKKGATAAYDGLRKVTGLSLEKIKQSAIDLTDKLAQMGKKGATAAYDGLKKIAGLSLDKVKQSVSGLTDKLAQMGKKGVTTTYDGLKKIAKISLDKIKKSLSTISEKLTQIGKKSATAAYNGLKKVAGVSFKTLAVGIGAAATAAGALVTKSVQAYADFEQLKGGVDTLFKDDAGTVMKYANNAYKTAGLSANAYMETVTSFSASLLQSLGGDTEKAAKYADVAISDMADNSNKMGTSMESIQYAYSGFAKSNYTMLDNLKLGEPHYCRAA